MRDAEGHHVADGERALHGQRQMAMLVVEAGNRVTGTDRLDARTPSRSGDGPQPFQRLRQAGIVGNIPLAGGQDSLLRLRPRLDVGPHFESGDRPRTQIVHRGRALAKLREAIGIFAGVVGEIAAAAQSGP